MAAIEPQPTVEDSQANSPAPAEPGSKKNKKKGKKYVALPTLEAVEPQLPWSLGFSQRLGRHAVAKRDLPAGALVLQEAAVVSVVLEQVAALACHNCLQELPDNDQPAHAAVVDCAASQFHRFCSQRCQRQFMAAEPRWVSAVHARVRELAKATDCDAGMLRMLLELDSLRATAAGAPAQGGEGLDESKAIGKQPDVSAAEEHSSPEADAAKALQQLGVSQPHAGAQQGSSTQPSAQHQHKGKANGLHASDIPAEQDALPLVRCTLADVEALQSHWHQASEARRKVLTAGCTALAKAIQEATAQHDEQGSAAAAGKAGAQRHSSVQHLQELSAIVDGNIHSLGAGSRNQDVAVGMFPLLSMLNHSCDPNCCFEAEDRHINVRTTRAVKAGEQLCVTYINLFEIRAVRQQQLLATKFFRCRCERCSTPLDKSSDRYLQGVLCSALGCKGVLLEQESTGQNDAPWKCDTCGIEVPATTADGTGPGALMGKANIMWRHHMAVMRQLGHPQAKPLFESLLAEFEGPGKLHRLHMVLFDSLVPLMNCCRAMGDQVGAISHLNRLIAAMDELLHPNLPELANFLYLNGMLNAEKSSSAPPAMRARLKKHAKELLARAAAMRKICLGPNHPLTLAAAGKIRLV